MPIPSTTIDDVSVGFDGRTFRLLHSAQPWGDASWTLYDIPAYGSLTLTNETLVARGATDREAYQGAMRVTSNGGVFVTYPRYEPGAGSVARLFVGTEPGRARTRPTKR